MVFIINWSCYYFLVLYCTSFSSSGFASKNNSNNKKKISKNTWAPSRKKKTRFPGGMLYASCRGRKNIGAPLKSCFNGCCKVINNGPCEGSSSDDPWSVARGICVNRSFFLGSLPGKRSNFWQVEIIATPSRRWIYICRSTSGRGRTAHFSTIFLRVIKQHLDISKLQNFKY